MSLGSPATAVPTAAELARRSGVDLKVARAQLTNSAGGISRQPTPRSWRRLWSFFARGKKVGML
jgi:hypothetical protein